MATPKTVEIGIVFVGTDKEKRFWFEEPIFAEFCEENNVFLNTGNQREFVGYDSHEDRDVHIRLAQIAYWRIVHRHE